MWICLNNAFLSIVAAPYPHEEDLVVRARRRGDIEEVFPGYPVLMMADRNYQFRALVPRGIVGLAIAKSLDAIAYTNFKSSVPDQALYDAYFQVWDVLAQLQDVPSHNT